ncbi:ATP-binding protein [Aquabacterium sp. OR-4]|uniref:ATP-binding protein n=1 Tax=Aquabacterium sp. OR-4 TaxID=2978127 RepID=UPI0021B2B3F3|nr:sensor histidine kinase [Aquabacterium sp. OR-4]MDT7836169.1 sensor histidine kinase [Aquabacterium sp. OR-4]
MSQALMALALAAVPAAAMTAVPAPVLATVPAAVPVLAASTVVLAALAYLAALFGVAWWAERRAAAGRSVIGRAWVYALSLAVYCTAWTYFGSVGRAATGGLWFLPIYLGPTLGMMLAWLVVRKLVRITRQQRITSIADFIGSRYGKSQLLAGLVTLITVVGIVPYIALQLKAIAVGYALLTQPPGAPPAAAWPWWRDSTLAIALAMALFTMVFGTRRPGGGAGAGGSAAGGAAGLAERLQRQERHEGLVAAIAAESVVKLLAFMAVGAYVTWGLFDGPGALLAQAQSRPELARLLTLGAGSADGRFAWDQWLALMALAMLSLLCLPRQFQVMVIENVDERHLRRASWAFPAYLLLINLFVLPIALAGLLLAAPGSGAAQADGFVIALPLAAGQPGLALAAFIGGLSAATGMVMVEAIAVATMVCNDLVMPLLLRTGVLHRTRRAGTGDLTGLLLGIRRAGIAAILLLGYLYFRLAGEAYALVSIGLISFAAVAQFAPALLGGLYWKGGTRLGALAGLLGGFALWVYTLMLPSLARSGWLAAPGRGDWLLQGPEGWALLAPERLLGLQGLDPLTHALVWSLGVNTALYVGVSLWRGPSPREAAQALLFVDVFQRGAPAAALPGRAAADAGTSPPVFWRGRARLADLRALAQRFVGAARAAQLFDDHARAQGLADAAQIVPDARLVQLVETELGGAIGAASARVMVASVVDEEPLAMDDVLRMLDEASQLRGHAQALEAQQQALRRATDGLRAANERLEELDRLKDDFMSSVTHELRTPLTSIRALSELMHDDPDMAPAQRQQFLAIVVAETERLSRLVNQVLDMAKIESGHAEWRSTPIDLRALLQRAVDTTAEMFHARGAELRLHLPAPAPAPAPTLLADEDRLMQVLMNLLSNAAKFAPAVGGCVSVMLDCDADGCTVRVHDNGPGVPVAQRALIFEKFRQGGDALHRPAGTGLGLPISRQIVEHFGGRMWLEADAAQGACFAFALPWQHSHNASGDKP